MRRRCSSSQVDARIESCVATVPTPVIVGLIADDYAVLSTNGKAAAVVVMRGVIVNHRVRCPNLEAINGPPSTALCTIIAGAALATAIAHDSRCVRARCTLYEDPAAGTGANNLIARDDNVIAGNGHSN